MSKNAWQGKRASGSDPPCLELFGVGDLVKLRGDTTLVGRLGCVLEHTQKIPPLKEAGPDYYLILVDNRKILYHRDELILEKRATDA
tara:strand:+ start:448 stop:708 length:261 start_codon:yes stop_codon:yes gene_type:complete